MKLSKKYTTITTLSKTIALILFISLPFLGFYLGMQYQKGLDQPLINSDLSKPEKKACTMEAKLCSDGSSVGRVGPNCEFAKCPTKKP